MKYQKISFYTFTKSIDSDIVRVIKNIYSFVTEIVVLYSEPKTNNTLLTSLDNKKIIKIFFKPFSNFADMRNYAINHLSGDWILTLDSDETFSSTLLKNIRRYVNNTNVNGYKFRRKCLKNGKFTIKDPFSQLRLFRQHKNVRYVGTVHEHLSQKDKIFELKSWKSVIYHYKTIKDMVIAHQAYNNILLKELSLAEKSNNPDLINFAKLRIWSNNNIDNPKNYENKKMMSKLKKIYLEKKSCYLGKRKDYLKQMDRLQKLYQQS